MSASVISHITWAIYILIGVSLYISWIITNCIEKGNRDIIEKLGKIEDVAFDIKLSAQNISQNTRPQ